MYKHKDIVSFVGFYKKKILTGSALLREVNIFNNNKLENGPSVLLTSLDDSEKISYEIMSYSLNENYLLIYSYDLTLQQGLVDIYDIRTNSCKLLSSITNNSLSCSVILVDHQKIITRNKESAMLWSIDGSLISRIGSLPRLGENSMPTLMSLYKDDYLLLVGGPDYSSIQIWMLANNRLMMTLENIDNINCLAVYEEVIVAGSNDILIFDIKWSKKNSKYNTTILKPIKSIITCIAISKNYIASGSSDFIANLWSRLDNTLLCEYKGHINKIISIAINDDESSFITGSEDKYACLWSCEDRGQIVYEISSEISEDLLEINDEEDSSETLNSSDINYHSSEDSDYCDEVSDEVFNEVSIKKFITSSKLLLKDLTLNNSITKITDLKSLITVLDNDCSPSQKKLLDSLKELNNLIGLESFKQQIINQILFFLEDLVEPNLYLHTVITGPPGVGKTTVIKILAKIYCSLGILKYDKVLIADRSMLISEHIGETSINMQKILNSALGGILLIDEAYSLGSKGSKDSYAKECIDSLNQYLSEHVSDFICIIAGYENELNKFFFKQNSGLRRRFPWTFNIDKYTSEELSLIFKKQVADDGWMLEKGLENGLDILKKFQDNMGCFGGNGGSTKNLLDKCKICYARRVIGLVGLVGNVIKEITKSDFEEAFLIFRDTEKVSEKICKICRIFEERNKKIDNCSNCKKVDFSFYS